ncbi:hypothetical protein [Spirosoma pollinicola]|uniref:hypothetical protein n=1 Tax=Spirosoma pollinicola TaxID=2057025 RepID=UPI0012FD4FEE|nr:hypothetical protein [Spirosoma pollinicola]
MRFFLPAVCGGKIGLHSRRLQNPGFQRVDGGLGVAIKRKQERTKGKDSRWLS